MTPNFQTIASICWATHRAICELERAVAASTDAPADIRAAMQRALTAAYAAHEIADARMTADMDAEV